MRNRLILAVVAVCTVLFAVNASAAYASRLPAPATPQAAHADLEATYNARMCIMDHESRNNPDPYTVKNPHSSAYGAYQWMPVSWPSYLAWAEAHYGLRLTSSDEDAHGARVFASATSHYTQDLVTAFALLYRQGKKPWTGGDAPCWYKVGTTPNYLDGSPLNAPSDFVQAQMVSWVQSLAQLGPRVANPGRLVPPTPRLPQG